jgi:hypothetical protein
MDKHDAHALPKDYVKFNFGGEKAGKVILPVSVLPPDSFLRRLADRDASSDGLKPFKTGKGHIFVNVSWKVAQHIVARLREDLPLYETPPQGVEEDLWLATLDKLILTTVESHEQFEEDKKRKARIDRLTEVFAVEIIPLHPSFSRFMSEKTKLLKYTFLESKYLKKLPSKLHPEFDDLGRIVVTSEGNEAFRRALENLKLRIHKQQTVRAETSEFSPQWPASTIVNLRAFEEPGMGSFIGRSGMAFFEKHDPDAMYYHIVIEHFVKPADKS